MVVNNLPAMQETWVLSLGLEDPLEKGMAICSSILAWRIPWTEEPAGSSPWNRKELTNTFTFNYILKSYNYKCKIH